MWLLPYCLSVHKKRPRLNEEQARSCHTECSGCSGDSQDFSQPWVKLDTGASDREEETLSRSITSLLWPSHEQPDALL